MPVFNFSTRTSARSRLRISSAVGYAVRKMRRESILRGTFLLMLFHLARYERDYTDSDSRTILHPLIRARVSIAGTICDLFASCSINGLR
jgi:uncharacterized membrane protein (Fun14 family)